MKTQRIDRETSEQIIISNDSFLFDCDGVLWIGSEPIQGAGQTLQYLSSLGKSVYFLTNNSTKSRSSYVAKLEKLLGYKAEINQIISTSWLVCEYLKSIDFDGLIYLVGSEGIAEELRQGGFKFIGLGPDPYPQTPSDFVVSLDPKVECVVAGFDAHISYPKIAKAASYISKRDSLFIITNEDPTLPNGNNNDVVIPGTGSIVSTIKVASSRSPVVLGKPSDFAWTLLQRIFGLIADRTLMIGDRLETDIAFGRNCSLSTLAVLTGHTSLLEIDDISKTVAGSSSNLIPHYVADRVDCLLPSAVQK